MFEAYKPRDYNQNLLRNKKDISVSVASKRKAYKPKPQLSKVSPKRKADNKIYTKLRKAFLEENSECQIKWDGRCAGAATQVHHVKFRGKYYLDVRWWKSGCAHCHRMVTDNGREAERRGHIVRERQV